MFNNNRDDNVEFIVRAATDLILKGKEQSIKRVTVNTPYSCIMLRTQRFSSLFRHYAKHHGLCRETLTFYFTEKLQPEDTPESVHLQQQDTILVRQNLSCSATVNEDDGYEDNQIINASDSNYFSAMRSLLYNAEETGDVTLEVGNDSQLILAHRNILMARSDYFMAMLKSNTLIESKENYIRLKNHSYQMVSNMLEFIYTNRIENLNCCSMTDLLELYHLSDVYLLSDLKLHCENALKSLVDDDNVILILSEAERCNGLILKKNCLDYIVTNASSLAQSIDFRRKLESHPTVSVMVFESLALIKGDITEPKPPKKRRIGT